MAASLLAALGLAAPARGLPSGRNPGATGATGPTGPFRAPGDTPRDEIAAPPRTPAPPKPGGSPTPAEPSDADIARAKAVFAANAQLGAAQLAALAARVGDKARRDPIVRALRDGLVRIQPFTSDKSARKALDKALDDLAEKGLSKGFLKLLELAIGKDAVEVKRPDPNAPPPATKPDEAPGEKIVAKDIPFGKPPKVPSLGFRFLGVAARYRPGQNMSFTVQTPDRVKLDVGGATRVRIAPKTRVEGDPVMGLDDRRIPTTGSVPMTLRAPDAPGSYVLYIFAGAARLPSPEQTFDVVP